MPNSTDDPASPSSSLSRKARLAHWITGGTNRGPSTISSFSRMARDRNDIDKATEAWALARDRRLGEHQGQWGMSGVSGALEQARGTSPRPSGTALIRWFRGGGGDRQGAESGDATGQPQVQQQGWQGQGQTRTVEDDIYGADGDTMGESAERRETGDSDTAEGTATGGAVGQ